MVLSDSDNRGASALYLDENDQQFLLEGIYEG
jgi:hypothetical protein